jgi:hypothetical protein
VARLYTNENFPLPAVEELRRRGHDVLTTYEAGQSGQRISDVHVLAHASSDARILVTLNRRHFIRLHRESSTHSGIIVCSVDPMFIALARRIDAAIQANPQMAGQLIRVDRPGA